MDLSSKRDIKLLLKRYGVRPAKRLGQNFLVDRKALEKIIEAADLQSNDIVLEAGPGLGALTQELAKRAKKVIAVEKDPKMVEILKETLNGFKNIEIIQSDILKIQNTEYRIQNTEYKLVANLPYYITAPTIRKFLEAKNQPKKMILAAQKEVAQRICQNPPRMNLLAVSVQFYAKPEIVSFISKKSFFPQPKVDSAILQIAPRIDADKKRINTDLFFKIIKAGFSQPRKQLFNNLTKKLKLNKEDVKSWLLKNGIQPIQRAETLNVENWLKLAKTFNNQF